LHENRNLLNLSAAKTRLIRKKNVPDSSFLNARKSDNGYNYLDWLLEEGKHRIIEGLQSEESTRVISQCVNCIAKNSHKFGPKSSRPLIFSSDFKIGCEW
jgi:hypothetical protein